MLILSTGDKWQSKTLFLAIFYPRPLIVKSIFDCRLPSVLRAFYNCGSRQENIILLHVNHTGAA